MPYNSGVYIIENKQTHSMYVGSSSQLEKRIMDHKSLLKHNKHSSKLLQSDYNTFGKEGFYFYPVVFCPKDMLIYYEQQIIDLVNSNYNTCRYAGSCKGLKQSEETRIKQSNSNKGKHKEFLAGFKCGFKPGKEHWNCKISDEDVKFIVFNYKNKLMSSMDLAKKFNIGQPHIYRIVSGKRRNNFKENII